MLLIKATKKSRLNANTRTTQKAAIHFVGKDKEATLQNSKVRFNCPYTKTEHLN